jgi:hypothetical protein
MWYPYLYAPLASDIRDLQHLMRPRPSGEGSLGGRGVIFRFIDYMYSCRTYRRSITQLNRGGEGNLKGVDFRVIPNFPTLDTDLDKATISAREESDAHNSVKWGNTLLGYSSQVPHQGGVKKPSHTGQDHNINRRRVSQHAHDGKHTSHRSSSLDKQSLS